MTQGGPIRVTRAVLTERLQHRVGLERADAAACVDSVLALITRALCYGDKVKLVGFGQFLVRDRAARKSVHPGTGKPIVLPARRVVRFKPSRTLLELMELDTDDG